jgi:hypothetical protein
LGTLFNPKSPKQKVARGKINGLWGVDKWHGFVIPNLFVKVDIPTVHATEVPLMVTNEAANRFIARDAIWLFALWIWKYVNNFV